MLKKIKQYLLKRRIKNEEFGSFVPIVKTIKISPNVSKEQLKFYLVKEMLAEISNYVYTTEEQQENGTILLTARIDVLRRDKINVS